MLCMVSLHAGVNEPYKPDWANEYDIEILRQVFSNLPEHLNIPNPCKEFAAWHMATSQVENPNALQSTVFSRMIMGQK